MADVTFHGWLRRAGNDIGPVPVAGRPVSDVGLHASDTTGHRRDGTISFALHGPGDVSGLLPGAIRARFPRPGQTDAESLYCPYVDLSAEDLPWRYSPRGVESGEIRPWLALLVLTPQEVVARPRDRITVAAAALNGQLPASGTAHVQKEGDSRTSRVLCLRDLASNTDYVAFLVPAFRPDGSQAWDGTRDETLQVYDEWRFRTGEAGTFRTLASKLRAADELAGFGRINVAVGAQDGERVDVRGALTGIGEDTDLPPPAGATARLETLLALGTDPDGRRFVRPPRYGEVWRADVEDGAPAGGWVTQLQGDPTHRVVAGLGLLAGVHLQDEIVGAAGDRLGATEIVNQRIDGLVAGLTAARSLWRRRLPTERDGRLRLLGLAAGRILARGEDGSVGSVLDRATGPDRTLPAALFSSAAIRMLRPGSARLRHARAGATALISVANEPRPTVRRPEDAGFDPRHSGGVADADTLVRHLSGSGVSIPGAEKVARGDDLVPALVIADVDGLDRETRERLEVVGGLRPEAAERPQPRPADLDELDRALVVAFDPFGEPVAEARVRATFDPDDDPEPLAPREPCIDLDLPAWRYLRDRHPEWLLPGAATLEDGEVVGLASNPVFADAFLVGWNSQALGELRWRNIRVASGCTPLRRFWDRSARDPASGGWVATTDIVGIGNWVGEPGGAGVDPRSLPLGDSAHVPAGQPARHLVVCFRTDLFRRYPSTLVYLAGPPPPAVPSAADLDGRILPSFVAQVSSNLVLYAFAVEPTTLAAHWVVVEQQPPGFRFDRSLDTAGPGGSSAARAAAMLVRPVRVVLAGDGLAGGGN